MSALGQISRVKHVFRKDTLVTVINSLVFSKLYYCSSIWLNTSAINIRKLQGVQNFAAHIVSGTYLQPSPPTFKSMTGQVPNYLNSRGNISSWMTRSSTLLNIPLFKTKSGQRPFYYRTLTLWNALKPHCKLSESLICKNKVNGFLLNQFLMS